MLLLIAKSRKDVAQLECIGQYEHGVLWRPLEAANCTFADEPQPDVHCDRELGIL
jgi:hypothetical protein